MPTRAGDLLSFARQPGLATQTRWPVCFSAELTESASTRGDSEIRALASLANVQWVVKMYKRLQMALVVD